MIFSCPAKPEFRETWVWGNQNVPQQNLQLSFQEIAIKFISNGKQYSSISAYTDRREIWICYHASGKADYVYEGDPKSGGSFIDANFATMIFLEPITNQLLLAVLERCATKL